MIGHRLREDLEVRISECVFLLHTNRLFVELVDKKISTVQIFHEYKCLHVVDNGLQLRGSLLHPFFKLVVCFGERYLRLLAVGNILNNRHKIFRVTLLIKQQGNGQVDPDSGTVLAIISFVHGVSFYFPIQHLPDILEISIQVVGVGDILKGQPKHLVL